MKWFLCTRTRDEDYFSSWLRSPSAAATTDYASVSDVLEGADSDRRYCALIRRHTQDPLTLSVSVSTDRKDAVGSPIRDFVCLEAESVKDEERLAEYFSKVLRMRDVETIYDAKSSFANVFEELYRTRSLNAFEQRFDGAIRDEGRVISKRIEFPRSDMASRLQASNDVFATVKNGDSFAMVMGARSVSKIIEGLNLTGMPIRMFSELTKVKSECPDFHQAPFPFNRTGAKIAAAAAVAMVIWAIVLSCFKKESMSSQKIAEESQKTQSCATNSVPFSGNLAVTNRLETVK